MHITIATTGDRNPNPEKELQLVKLALFYGDRVTLCSPKASLLNIMLSLKKLSADDRKTFIRVVAPLLPEFSSKDKEKQEQFFHDVYRIVFGEHNGGRYRTSEEIARGGRIKQSMKNFQSTIGEFIHSNGADKLAEALSSGLVDLYPFQTSDAGIVHEYVKKVETAMANGDTFPLLDDETGHLVSYFRGQGEIAVSDVDKNRMKHVALACDLFKRLPGLEDAPLDAIIDIRNEFEKPLKNFRSAMVEYAENIQSATWDADFSKEAELLFIQKVEPAMSEIEEQMRTTHALQKYLNPIEVLSSKSMLGWGTLGAVIAQAESLPFLTSVAIGAGIGLIAGATSKINEEKQAGKKNQLYYYHIAKNRLS